METSMNGQGVSFAGRDLFGLWVGFAPARLAGMLVLFAALMGPRAAVAQEDIFTANAQWRFFRGTEEPLPSWLSVDFDDSGWETGTAGFGFADNDDSTILSDMQGSYVSVYIRKTFELADPNYAVFELRIRYDDGFVAYINGVEVARSASMSGAGTRPTFNALSGDHEASAIETFIIDSPPLRAGKNVIAIQGHNSSLTSSDFSLDPQGLRAHKSVCPNSIRCTPSTQDPQDIRVTWTLPLPSVTPEVVEIFRDGVFIGTPSSALSRVYQDNDVPPGEHTYEVVATINGVTCEGEGVPSCTILVTTSDAGSFRRGDIDANGSTNLSDAIFVLLALFQSGQQPTCPDAADVDDTGVVNLSDPIYLLIHLFQAGPAVPAPGIEACGPDTTVDELADCTYTVC